LIAPDCRQDEAVLIMGNRYAPCGYAWAFPWGEHRVRLGVGILHADSTANPKEYLPRFLAEAGNFDINLSGYQIKENHFGLVPADGIAKYFVSPGLMAVGDAAGQASLIAGEGIRLSMRAGLLAGQTAAQAVKKGQFERRDLISYERVFNAQYRRNLKIGYLVELLKSVPDRLLTQLLQSEFSSLDFTLWLASRPRLWPKVLKYGLKMIGTKFQFPRDNDQTNSKLKNPNKSKVRNLK
jgi:flavin-dependent dehydrogenase